MVARFYGPLVGFEMKPGKRGDYVRFADYATLRAENEQLRRDRDAIRHETLEEAAKVAEPLDNGHSSEYKRGRRAAATIIRSLKEPSDV